MQPQSLMCDSADQDLLDDASKSQSECDIRIPLRNRRIKRDCVYIFYVYKVEQASGNTNEN